MLDPFVSSILSGTKHIEAAAVTIDQYVFEPKNLAGLVTARNLPASYTHDWTITVEGKDEVNALLKACLSDWLDFWFVPSPKPFVIYADHDEYTTIYAATKSNLNHVANRLATAGFKRVTGFQRKL